MSADRHLSEPNIPGNRNTKFDEMSSDSRKNDVSIAQILQSLTKRSTWDGFFRTPCVQSSYLWGMGCGALMFAHKSRLYKGKFGTALNFGFFTFLGVSSLSFLNCTTELRQRTEMIQNAFKQKDILPAEKK